MATSVAHAFHHCTVAVACSAVMLAAGPAAASPAYPGAIQDQLDLGCAPPCTICHRTSQGGFGTIVPGSFGAAMVTHGGLSAANPDRLRCALQLLDPSCRSAPACAPAGLDCSAVDSDDDGQEDIEELRRLTDPNSPSDTSLCGPTYGCGATVAEARPPRTALLLLALGATAVGFVLTLRRSRRHR